jgi:hypothetical protein
MAVTGSAARQGSFQWLARLHGPESHNYILQAHRIVTIMPIEW